MGKSTGFMKIVRQERHYQPVEQRIQHCNEFVINFSEQELRNQGARCMDCGIPYCQTGCPVNNVIPDWNDLVCNAKWKVASEILHSTNNFPEFTGRICPAPCEAACTLNIEDQPVTIKSIECSIVERAWSEGWIEPDIPKHRSGKHVAIVGSGPAGLACAQQLARAGHSVHLYEKNDRSGGLLRYGIPDFKLDKKFIDRRMAQMKTEGIKFHSGVNIGVDISVRHLMSSFDAIVLAIGCEEPRNTDSSVAGRNYAGVHFAIEFLTHSNKLVQGMKVSDESLIYAAGKNVVVIGGGDTGSDCIGTAIRQKAKSITQIEILSQPPERENKALVWPNWPHKMRTSSSQEEGCERLWNVKTLSFEADDKGNVSRLNCIKVVLHKDNNEMQLCEISGSEFQLDADLVLLAMGFMHVTHSGLLEQMRIELDNKGNVKAQTRGYRAYQTNIDKVFSAGDARRGQSLVVWGIHEGRQCAKAVNVFLMG